MSATIDLLSRITNQGQEQLGELEQKENRRVYEAPKEDSSESRCIPESEKTFLSKSDIEIRLGNLRDLMRASSLIGYIVPSSDEFLGEFTPPCARRLEYITGFTGSNGLAIILLETVLFFTDGRYLEQASIELDSNLFEIFAFSQLKVFDWDRYFNRQEASLLSNSTTAKLDETLSIKGFIGFDPRLFRPKFINALGSINESNSKLKPDIDNLIDRIWYNQPAKPSSKVYDYPIQYSGTTRDDKIDRLRKELESNIADAVIIMNPEEVCWLFNIRASDLEFTPVLLSYAIITKYNAYLFCDPCRVEQDLLESMSRISISLLPLDAFENCINSIEGIVLYDPDFVSYHLSTILLHNETSSAPHSYTEDTSKIDRNIKVDGKASNYDQQGIELLRPHMKARPHYAEKLAASRVYRKKSPSFVSQWKAIKNEAELKWMQQAHIQDGVAVIEMLSFLSNASAEDLAQISEYDISVMLTELRSKGNGYVMDSFPSIVGFKENAAVIHYRPDTISAKKLSIKDDTGEITPRLLLIDSGGQYMGATTDITRVVMLGLRQKNSDSNDVFSCHARDCVEKYRKFYTKVLKGHLQLAMIQFPYGNVTGGNLDILARQYLWKSGLDYNHGTGHGVGSFLSVHEGPCSISLVNSYPIEAGMVLSNEPGYYAAGEFGIRIENMMYSCPVITPADTGKLIKRSNDVDRSFLGFEMLTMVPYSSDLIDPSMLSTEEVEYLKNYYQKISLNLRHLLSDQAIEWLDNEARCLMTKQSII